VPRASIQDVLHGVGIQGCDSGTIRVSVTEERMRTILACCRVPFGSTHVLEKILLTRDKSTFSGHETETAKRNIGRRILKVRIKIVEFIMAKVCGTLNSLLDEVADDNITIVFKFS
jgi:hypothetical protein